MGKYVLLKIWISGTDVSSKSNLFQCFTAMNAKLFCAFDKTFMGEGYLNHDLLEDVYGRAAILPISLHIIVRVQTKSFLSLLSSTKRNFIVLTNPSNVNTVKPPTSLVAAFNSS